jgi:DNA-directed RNA polymerase subunit RPC12/RpoP
VKHATYKCFECKDNYNLNLQLHNEKIKLGMKYLCMICSKYFAGIDNLFKHIAEAHDTIPEHFLFDKQKINLMICLSYLKKKKSGSKK